MLYAIILSWIFHSTFATERSDDVNLLVAVGSPLPYDVFPVTGPFGSRGRPAIEFTSNSYVGRYARDLLPLPFYKDFGIKVTIFLHSIRGGVLFSVVSPDQRKDILLLEVKKYGRRNQTIELSYRNTNPSDVYKARFIVPKFSRRWTVFSIAVRGQQVWLYLNGCQYVQGLALMKNREPLVIDKQSVVYIGRAGWYSRKRPLFVSLFFNLFHSVEIYTKPCCFIMPLKLFWS